MDSSIAARPDEDGEQARAEPSAGVDLERMDVAGGVQAAVPGTPAAA